MRKRLPRDFNWRAFEFSFRIPDDAPSKPLMFTLYFWGDAAKASTVIIDSLKLEKISKKQTRNYIINSSFETTSIPGIPDYWRNTGRRMMDPDLWGAGIDTTQHVSGKQSLALYFNTEKFDNVLRSANLLLSAYVYPPENEMFTFSAWMKADRPGIAVDMVMWWRKKKICHLTTNWKRYSFSNVWLPKGSRGNAFIGILGARSRLGKPLQGRIWIDDIQVERGDSMTRYTPAYEDAKRGSKLKEAVIKHPLPSIVIKRAAQPPLIDGYLTDPCWKNIPVASNFVVPQLAIPASLQTSVKMVYDDKALYLSCVCHTMKPPLATAKPGNVKSIFSDDVFEFFFQPDDKKDEYYHLAINANGALFDEKATYDKRVLAVVGGMGCEMDRNWNSRAKVASAFEQNGWTAEIRIPWFSFDGFTDDASGARLNFRRSNPSDNELSSWSFVNGRFHSPNRFGYLKGLNLDQSANCVKLGNPIFSLNPKSGATLVCFSVLKVPKDIRFTLTLPDGTSEKLPFTADGISFSINSGRFLGESFSIKACDAANNPVFIKDYKFVRPSIMKFLISPLVFREEGGVECAVDLNFPESALSNLRLLFSFDDENTSENMAVTSKNMVVSVPTNNLKNGAHVITCRLKNKKRDKTLALLQRSFSLAKRKECYVRMNPASLSFEKDGKPFFPMILTYCLGDKLENARQHGFNTVSFPPYNAKLYRMGTDEYMNALKKSGMGVIVNFGPMLRFADVLKLEKDDVKSKIRMFIQKYRDHPSIVAYEVQDEPGVLHAHKRPFSSHEDLTAFYHFIKKLDPYRPVFVNFAPNLRYWKDLSYTDIIAYDYYSTPVSSSERTIDKHNYFDDIAYGKSIENGIPFLKWVELDQGCTELAIRLMRPDEERCVTFLSIVNGARAVAYFDGRPWNDSVWMEMAKIGKLVEKLTPVICSPDPVESVNSSNKAVRIMLKKRAGAYYIFVVNYTATDQKVEVSLYNESGKPLFSSSPRIEKLSACGDWEWRNGRLRLNMKQYGVGIFELK